MCANWASPGCCTPEMTEGTQATRIQISPVAAPGWAVSTLAPGRKALRFVRRLRCNVSLRFTALLLLSAMFRLATASAAETNALELSVKVIGFTGASRYTTND